MKSEPASMFQTIVASPLDLVVSLVELRNNKKRTMRHTAAKLQSWGVREEMTGQLLVLQVLESVVPVATESFNCRSGLGGILLISNQDTTHRWGHVELKALVKLSGEYRSTIDLLTLSTSDGSAGVGADRYRDVVPGPIFHSTPSCFLFFFSLSMKRTGK